MSFVQKQDVAVVNRSVLKLAGGPHGGQDISAYFNGRTEKILYLTPETFSKAFPVLLAYEESHARAGLSPNTWADQLIACSPVQLQRILEDKGYSREDVTTLMRSRATLEGELPDGFHSYEYEPGTWEQLTSASPYGRDISAPGD